MRAVPENVLDGRRTRRAPHRARGVLSTWLGSLRRSEQARLFDRLIQADVALAASLSDYARTPRMARMCFLLMNECAAARSIHIGELVLLFPGIESEAPRAMQALVGIASSMRRNR